MPISTITRNTANGIRDYCGKKAISACRATTGGWNSASCASSRFSLFSRPPRVGARLAPAQGRRLNVVSLELHDAADDDRVSSAADFPAGEWAISALRTEPLRVDGPFRRRINDSHVGLGAGAERAAVDAEDAGGIDRQLLDEL